MYQEKRIAVIIAAAGSGTRMGSGISKQFLVIGDQMVLEKSMEAFSRHPYIDDIYLVVRETDIELCRQKFTEKDMMPKLRTLIAGGAERQESVFCGLQEIEKNQAVPTADVVLIHDAARPFVSGELIKRVTEAAVMHRAAAPGLAVKDTIKRAEDQWFAETLTRDGLYAIQTPQGFERELLMNAHNQAIKEKYTTTDDAALVEKIGTKVFLVSGQHDNIKITTKEDIPPQSQQEWRTGSGFDVHRFDAQCPLILGGVEIPFEKGLLGHSDADVLTHAIMDALLGACGLGDIGCCFPDKEEQYRGISSMILLSQVAELIKKEGFHISNIDGTLVGERPKLAPYSGEIKKKIADILHISESNINIKGTTTEGLGFCGREEGLAALATATVFRNRTL